MATREVPGATTGVIQELLAQERLLLIPSTTRENQGIFFVDSGKPDLVVMITPSHVALVNCADRHMPTRPIIRELVNQFNLAPVAERLHLPIQEVEIINVTAYGGQWIVPIEVRKLDLPEPENQKLRNLLQAAKVEQV